MSIAVSDVRTRVRQITQRDNTTELPNDDIDALILEACREISKRRLCLKNSTTGTLAASGTTISKPSDMVDSESAIDSLYLDSKLEDPITFDEWRAGYVTGYAYRDQTIYVHPSTSNTRDYTLYYRAMHGALSTNLEFEDDLKMAVVWLTAKKTYDNYFAESNAPSEKAEREYERELALNAPAEPTITRLRKTRE